MLVELNTKSAKGKKVTYPSRFAKALIKRGLASEVVEKPKTKAKKKTKSE